MEYGDRTGHTQRHARSDWPHWGAIAGVAIILILFFRSIFFLAKKLWSFKSKNKRSMSLLREAQPQGNQPGVLGTAEAELRQLVFLKVG